MNKHKKQGSYESWKYSNDASLQVEYKGYLEKNYNPTMPDTYVSFDDFCMGQWQWLD